MTDVDEKTTEDIVREWESVPQNKLASLFGDYIYRIKEWINGNWAYGLNEHNIYKFKGITRFAHSPFAQFYKSAYSYAELVNSSAMPFVAGTKKVNAFQLNSPIIAGKPFFDYTKHYYEILEDIRDNSQYEGFYIKGNAIVDTLNKYFGKGVGNNITRLLFDTVLLLYVDRFCPATYPTQEDTNLFEQSVVDAFIWVYSLRAQYTNLGWQSAQNYILERSDKKNSFNMYKIIEASDNPVTLLSDLADRLVPLFRKDIAFRILNEVDIEDKWQDEDKAKVTYKNYMHFFKSNTYYND